MSVFLRVEPCHAEHAARGLAFLDPVAMSEGGIQPGDVVEITTGFGKGVLARVAEPIDSDAGQGFVRVDQYVRQSLKSLIGDMVEVEKVTVGTVDRLVLAPLIDLSHIEDLEQYLVKTFTSAGLPVSKGEVLYATLPGAKAGSAFKVIELDPGPGLVTESTVIQLRYVFSVWPSDRVEVTFEDVGGMAKEVQLVRELVELPMRFPDAYRQLGINPPRGIIFYGPPGSGKTHLTRAIANELNAKFLYINGPDIISTHYGETESNLRKVFQEASHHLPSLILIDELDVLVPKRGASGSFTDTRMSTQFLELLDGLKNVQGVMVIGTTNRVDSIDAAARRPGRFDREIFIGPPDRAGRLQILQIHTRGMPLAPGVVEYLPELARVTHGFVGADIMELCREAGLNCLRRHVGEHWTSLARLDISLTDLIVERGDFQQSFMRARPSAMRESITSIPDIAWDEIGGLEEVKDRLSELVEKPLLYPAVFSKMQIDSPKGILLHGPPGGGKTLLAKAIASQCQANFISVKGPEVYSKWLGESEQGIREIFRVARQVAPAVIFFDQIDAIAPLRGTSDSGTRAAERVVNQMLTEIDGIEPMSGIVVIGATNRFDLLDPAILRPGRFGVHVCVPLPDACGRRAILTVHLRRVTLEDGLSSEDVADALAPHTEGFSGAELEVICQEAKLAAARESGFTEAVAVKLGHFFEALERVDVSRQVYITEPVLT